ncbi:MAG: hypothetical protein JO225_00610 [Candidatus Eremiobacteraeota bacterium]|nr:hypothetical protein [Candidatus Eremiobacteraeota bacterium]
MSAPLAAAAADAPPPIKVMRTLVYDVTYSAHSSHEKKTSGFNAAYGSGPGAGAGAGVSSGNGTAGVGLDGNDSGTLTFEVVAATPDGGLVIDISYTGSLGTQPKTRIALFPDGRLSAPPNSTLGPEVVHVLPLLARGFIANRDVSPGSSWNVAAPAPARGSTSYRVTRLDGQQATIALEGTLTVSGINGFSEFDRGTTTYATDVLSPVAYDLNAHIRRQLSVDESVTTDAHLTAKLVSDSFAKKT